MIRFSPVDEPYLFLPSRRQGSLFQGALVVIFGCAGLLSLIQGFRTPVGLEFVLYFLAAWVAAAIMLWALYRWLALHSAFYSLERSGLRLRWGLRLEEIPLNSVRWVRSEAEVRRQLGQRLPLPWGALPGAIVGRRSLADGTVLDYLASDFSKMVLVVTDDRVFILSPERRDDFLFFLQRTLELGSISSWKRRSHNPASFLGEVWRNRVARLFLGLGLIGSLALWIWVSLRIPNLGAVYISSAAEEPAPAAFLLLLPLANGFFYVLNALGGLYFYRRSLLTLDASTENPSSFSLSADKVYAYLLWGCGVVTTGLFYLSVSFAIYVE